MNVNKTNICATDDYYFFTMISGTLRFGKFDVTETQLSIIFVHFMSAIFGTGIWDTEVRSK